MYKRISLGAIALAGLAITILSGCSATEVDTLTISPTSQTLQVAQTAQFKATGIVGHGQHPSSSEDVTNTVTWSSSAPAIATISATGLATAVSPGTTTITATMQGFKGQVSATATITVSGSAGGSTTGTIASLTIIPGSQSVASPGLTTQFLAIGTTSSGATVNLTSQVAWTSSSPQIASIGATTGLATATAQGTVTITALYSNPTTSSVVTGTALFTVTGGTAEQYTALSITPGTQSLSASGQTGQFLALAKTGSGQQLDVTSSKQLTWSSSSPSIATISSTGLVTGVSAGSSTITAELTNPDGTLVTANATVNVTLTAPPSPLLSLTIIPSSISVGDLQDTGQFLAIGTFSTPPYTRDLTNSPGLTWLSSFPSSFPVNSNSGGTSSASAGIVTAYGTGSATIIAEYTNQDPSNPTIQTATATFSCPLVLPNPSGNPPTPGSCYQGQSGPLTTTLTIYGEGLNTTNWLITAPSATGTPNVIHCGPGWAANGGTGGSVCTGIYPINSTVTLTAPAQSGVAFGGWTSDCTPTTAVNASGPNTCTVVLGTTNATVGAIFNNQ